MKVTRLENYNTKKTLAEKDLEWSEFCREHKDHSKEDDIWREAFERIYGIKFPG